MKLIAILVAMGTEGFWKSLEVLQQFQGLVRYAARLQARWGDRPWFNAAPGVLLTIAPPVLGVGIVQYALGQGGGAVAWLLSLVFAVALLAFSIGVREVTTQTEEYLAALGRNDSEGAYLYMRDIFAGRSPSDANHMNRMVVEALLVRNNERLLAILFWFVVLGPFGAVLYRSTTQLKGVARAEPGFDDSYLAAVLRLQAILDWLPARITALFYALIGSFVEALQHWRAAAQRPGLDIYNRNRSVLIASGIGALRLEEPPPAGEYGLELDVELLRSQVVETQALIQRTVIAWLAVFAVLTIIGWLA